MFRHQISCQNVVAAVSHFMDQIIVELDNIPAKQVQQDEITYSRKKFQLRQAQWLMQDIKIDSPGLNNQLNNSMP